MPMAGYEEEHCRAAVLLRPALPIARAGCATKDQVAASTFARLP
jgi:hypothetical protein